MIPYELIARYLAGECNEDEKKQIEEWSKQHPDIMDEYARIWQEVPADEFAPDVEQALHNVEKRIGQHKKKRSGNIFFIIGAAAAVLLLIVQFSGIKFGNTAEDLPLLLTMETGTTETTEFRLADGSKIWLNQSSTIRYPETFDGDTREIILEGEAFFDIAPNPDKPFIIRANNTVTRVVGTSFGIRAIADANEVVVTVSTGVVNFSAEGKEEQIELRQGEQGVCLPKEQQLEKNNNPDPNLLAWKTKILTFRETPLREVASVIENVYHRIIHVAEPIAQLQLTSTFEDQTLEDVLEILEMTLPIRIETNTSSGIILITPVH